MSFLQPWMLWALPAILLPLIIHLLNRLRYKTIKWAATMFLLKANKSATRRAKIRQYLLLASRVLIILFFIWAMGRPIIGGWLGQAAGGGPECVLILLDRSASMETTDVNRGTSKRAHALELLAKAAENNGGKSRLVLIESAGRQPMEVASAAALAQLDATQATDTAADVPAMLRAALAFLQSNRPGSAEIWLASDLQESNWRSESNEWKDIAAQLSALPQDILVRALDLSGGKDGNVALELKNKDFRAAATATPQGAGAAAGTPAMKGKLQLALELQAPPDTVTDATPRTLPLTVTRNGVKTLQDIVMASSVQRVNLPLEFAEVGATGGWGRLDLPADDNARDNTVYFGFTPPVPLLALIVSEQPWARRLRAAAAPDPRNPLRRAEIGQVATGPLKNASLVVWQGTPLSAEATADLEKWVRSGGVLLCLPPGPTTAPVASPFAISWNTVENAEKDKPFRVSLWDGLEGPLANTDSGTALPIAKLEINRRQVPAFGGSTAENPPHIDGSFQDGKSFLVSRREGVGSVYALATWPSEEWSTMGEGFVLVPVMQRLMREGGLRSSPPAMGVVGEWQPASADDIWTSVETPGLNWRTQAGIYQSGTRRIALNSPPAEFVTGMMGSGQIAELLPKVRVQVMTNAAEQKADTLQREIWPMLIVFAMLFMIAEMVLATSKGMTPVKAGRVGA